MSYKILLTSISVLRWIGIIAALIYVGINTIKTIKKAQQGQVIVTLMEKDLPEYLFPSVTICAKYKDGNSDVLPIIWLEQWNTSGIHITFQFN